jgi:uncharacterized protein (UPF0248 family)
METIQQLLSRIRWDDEFGKGVFEVGIYDRIENCVEFLPLEKLQMEKGNHFSFTVILNEEKVLIPYHRVREVRKNGETIWQR